MKKLITIGLCFFIDSTFAAERIPAIPEMLLADGHTVMVNDQPLQFGLLNSRKLTNGRTITRYQQKYQNIPVWGQTVLVSSFPGQRVPKVIGKVVVGIKDDLPSVQPHVALTDAVSIAVAQSVEMPTTSRVNYESGNPEATLWIYLDTSDKARLAYLINWDSARPLVFVDAVTGTVLNQP